MWTSTSLGYQKETTWFLEFFLPECLQGWWFEIHIFGPCDDKSAEGVGRYDFRTLCGLEQVWNIKIKPLGFYIPGQIFFTGASKFISLSRVETNPRNQLGDMISEPWVTPNRFQGIKLFLHVFRVLYRNGGSKLISFALAKTNPRNELGYMISEPCVEFNKFGISKRNHLVS